jgi:parvulin-like peptidyl-prolyl isomerase
VVLAGAGAPDDGAVANAIIALVNNEPITKLEADSLVREFYRDATNVPAADYRATWGKAREALIEHKLLIQEARRRQIAVSPDEVNAEIERLKRAGVDAENRRDELRERLMVSRMLAMFSTARAIAPADVAAYYEKHRDDFVLRERRHVLLLAIYARQVGGDKAAARKKAQELLDSLRKGEDFAVLAKNHSGGPFAEKGGDQGWMQKGSMLPALDEVAFRLKPGECSDLIETDDGFIILKVAGVQPASHQSLAEARPAIERRLQAEHRQKQRVRLIGRLRKTASILRLDVYPKTPPSPKPNTEAPPKKPG